jgi:hypothetical protein
MQKWLNPLISDRSGMRKTTESRKSRETVSLYSVPGPVGSWFLFWSDPDSFFGRIRIMSDCHINDWCHRLMNSTGIEIYIRGGKNSCLPLFKILHIGKIPDKYCPDPQHCYTVLKPQICSSTENGHRTIHKISLVLELCKFSVCAAWYKVGLD